MTQWDDFTNRVECIVCGREGTAVLRQAEGYAAARDHSTRVVKVPEGFRERPGAEAEFDCVDCDVPALC